MRQSAVRRFATIAVASGLGLILATAPEPVGAFALSEELTNGTPYPRDDLEDAARWSNTSGSLVADKKRGLGGGVEYAVAEDFCEVLLPRFIDDPKPQCADLLSAIARAFESWSDGHPVLKFTDVSGAVAPELPPRGAPDPRRGYGAEIDILAREPSGFPRPGPFGAQTQFYYVQADPVGTGGRPLPGNTLTSADIVLNPTKCFYLDPVLERSTCNHFETLVLHEIGVSLGLGQPDADARRNWDNDVHPENPVVIDCKEPTQGLRPSRRFDPNAVMISSKGLAQRSLPGLANDDIGGRDFLYPPCGASQ